MRSVLRVVAGVDGACAAAGIAASRGSASAAAETERVAITAEMWGQGLLSTPWDELNTVFSPTRRSCSGPSRSRSRTAA